MESRKRNRPRVGIGRVRRGHGRNRKRERTRPYFVRASPHSNKDSESREQSQVYLCFAEPHPVLSGTGDIPQCGQRGGSRAGVWDICVGHIRRTHTETRGISCDSDRRNRSGFRGVSGKQDCRAHTGSCRILCKYGRGRKRIRTRSCSERVFGMFRTYGGIRIRDRNRLHFARRRGIGRGAGE